MNPLVVLACLFAAATAAPAADPGYVNAPLVAAAPVIPDQYVGSTSHISGPPVTTIEQAPAVVTKQVHLGKTQFVSGYSSGILKPAIPDFNIAVPTVLKGTVAYNAPIVGIVKEPHVVNEPVPVERRVEVPYDVPVPREVIEEIAVPVHVDRPYAVPHPVAVQGETIVNYRRTQPVVQRTHSAIAAAPVAIAAAPVAVEHVGYAAAAPVAVEAAGYAGYAVAPAALGYAQAAHY